MHDPKLLILLKIRIHLLLPWMLSILKISSCNGVDFNVIFHNASKSDFRQTLKKFICKNGVIASNITMMKPCP